MKVGSDTADTLKKQSELQQIPFANLLWIYMAEDMMQRFYQSSYKEILWLQKGRSAFCTNKASVPGPKKNWFRDRNYPFR